MYHFVITTALLAASAASRPSAKLALDSSPAFDAAIWGAPCLVRDDNGKFYSMATSMYGMHVPQISSTDFKKWSWVMNSGGKWKKDAMPTLPTWVDSDPRLWAPDVSKMNSTHWIMYFTAVKRGTTQHCIGAAYSDNIDGPYTSMQKDGADSPWSCGAPGDQSIDPDGFIDTDGKRYVVWKHAMRNTTAPNNAAHWAWYSDSKLSGIDQREGTAPLSTRCGGQGPPYGPTAVTVREVSAEDGVTEIGPPAIVLDNLGWMDIGNTESPSMMRGENGYYFLFFSHGCFLDGTYTTSYAVSRISPMGPFVRNRVPFLSSVNPNGYRLSGPGTLDVLNDGGYGVFFSHEPNGMAKRPMRTLRFSIVGNHAIIDNV